MLRDVRNSLVSLGSPAALFLFGSSVGRAVRNRALQIGSVAYATYRSVSRCDLSRSLR